MTSTNQERLTLAKPDSLKWVEALLITLWTMFGWFGIFLGLAFAFQIIGFSLGLTLMAVVTSVLTFALGYGSIRAARYLWGWSK